MGGWLNGGGGVWWGGGRDGVGRIPFWDGGSLLGVAKGEGAAPKRPSCLGASKEWGGGFEWCMMGGGGRGLMGGGVLWER